jgi:hypothetical protein
MNCMDLEKHHLKLTEHQCMLVTIYGLSQNVKNTASVKNHNKVLSKLSENVESNKSFVDTYDCN